MLYLKNNSKIQLVKNLRVFKKEDNCLFIEPQSASWAITRYEIYEILKNTEKKAISFDTLKSKQRNLSTSKLKEVLTYLFNNNVIEIDKKRCFSEDPFLFSSNCISLGIIKMTNLCNLNCTYCYVKNRGRDYTLDAIIETETLKNIITQCLSLPQKNLQIGFHGGEPLLAFKQIRSAIKYIATMAKKYRKTIDFCIQTNGTILNEEMCKFLKQYKVTIGISFDGTIPLNNKYRRFHNGNPSSLEVIKRLRLLRKNSINFGVLAVVWNPGDIPSIIEFLIQEKIPRVRFLPLSGVSHLPDNMDDKKNLQKELARQIVSCTKLVIEKRIIIDNIYNVLDVIFTKKRRPGCMKYPCGAGLSQIAFDVNGDIYPCDDMIGIPSLKMGNINAIHSLQNTIRTSKALKHVRGRHVNLIIPCKDCTWKFFCGGGCTSRVYQNCGRFEMPDTYCEYIKEFFIELLWQFAKLSELKNL